MAYPFTSFPTLGEFIERAKEQYGAELRSIELTGPRGPTTVEFLVRINASDPQFAPLPGIATNDRLSPRVLRSLCRQLGLPLEDFGLILG